MQINLCGAHSHKVDATLAIASENNEGVLKLICNSSGFPFFFLWGPLL